MSPYLRKPSSSRPLFLLPQPLSPQNTRSLVEILKCRDIQYYPSANSPSQALSNGNLALWGSEETLKRRVDIPLLPLRKHSPNLPVKRPFEYSSVCSRATFIYPSRHVRRPMGQSSVLVLSDSWQQSENALKEDEEEAEKGKGTYRDNQPHYLS
jgi:hypothetical protein